MKTRTLICLIFIGLFNRTSFGQSDTSKYQLLWEIKPKNGATTSYIFGSMHSNDQRMFQFPDSVYVGIVKSQAIVVETDVAALFETYDVRLDGFNINFIEDGNNREGTRTAYGSEDGRPQFLDAYFQELAYISNKKLVTLETYEQQLATIEKISSSSSGSSVNYTDDMFKQAYLQGDIANLTKMLKAQLKGSPEAYETLISIRNTVMVNGLDTLMRKMNVFCTVGSGHLYGNDGILQLLKNKGFSVRRVSPSKGKTCVEKQTVINYGLYTHLNENYGFQVKMSGKPTESKDNGFYKAIYVELGQGNTYQVHVSPGESDLEGCKMEFLANKNYQPTDIVLEDGTLAIEGVVRSKILGYQWKRVFVKNGFTYELVCYGGNKFMHSNRPQAYFNRFETIPVK